MSSPVTLAPIEVELAGEAMVAAADRADRGLPTIGVPFVEWAQAGGPVSEAVTMVARYVTAANILASAIEAVGPVEVVLDRDDLIKALDALAVERDADQDGAGSPYRELAERLRAPEGVR